MSDPDLSVLLPCLDEAATVAECVHRARAGALAAGLSCEVVVADNGSVDGSGRVAAAAGARVVPVPRRGYGSALQGGMRATRGRWVVVADSDGSYDLADAPRFVRKLEEGYDLALGCRLPAGGGRVLPGAMPLLHRWCGNPLFSLLARVRFQVPGHDVLCGMRGFRGAFARSLGAWRVGMEFAVEVVLEAVRRGARIGEVPITLSPDGRNGRRPHLRTFRDGWRTLGVYVDEAGRATPPWDRERRG